MGVVLMRTVTLPSDRCCRPTTTSPMVNSPAEVSASSHPHSVRDGAGPRSTASSTGSATRHPAAKR